MSKSTSSSSTTEVVLSDDDLLEVGHIRRAHGLRGEVFVQLISDSDARVAPGAELIAGDKTLVVESSRVASNGRRVVKFAQIPDRTAAEIIELGHDEAMVRRVTRLVDIAEYKRRQSPPGVRVSRKAFGKDRRLPITSGYRG